MRYALHGDAKIACGLTLFQEPLGIVMSWILREIYRRGPDGEKFGIPVAARVMVLSLVCSVVQAGLAAELIDYFGWRNPAWSLLEEWLLRIIFYWLIYMGWSLLYFWLKTERLADHETIRAEAAQAEAERMELFFLRAQLDPHFLFNALNGIASEIPPHPDAALGMVRQLAGYLRYSLDRRSEIVTPLATEMDGLSHYLAIEQTRFGEKLSVGMEADSRARRRLVPSFLLQPLVENAVKHCIQKTEPPWDLQIGATLDGGILRIEARNTGTLRPGWQNRMGVGLQTLLRRLELHYPGRHRFTLEERDGVVRAEVALEGDPCSA